MNVSVRNGQIVNSLSQTVASEIANMDVLPGLLTRIIETDAWRSYTVEMLGTQAHFDNIEDWIEAKAPVGLGTTVEVLMDLCRHHPDLRAKLVQMLQEDDGRKQ